MLDFLKKNEEAKEAYWSILIEDQWVTSAVWQIKDGQVEIISLSPATHWDEDLIEAVDVTLSSCTQNLPEDFKDPVKTVFGVSSSWIEEGNIKEEYLVKLKKVCEELSLAPSGFVVLSEAIAHFIKSKEEADFSGITLGISDQSFELSIFSFGKLIANTIVTRSVSMSDDLLEGLSRLTVDLDNFPPRIIIYNQKESELKDAQDNLNSIDWEKTEGLKFLHAPNIEILKPDEKILAISLAGGAEISDVKSVSSSILLKREENLGTSDNEPDEQQTDISSIKSEELKNIQDPIGLTAEDLGFVVKKQPEIPANVIVRPQFPKLKMPKFQINTPRLPNFKFLPTSRTFVFGGISLFVLFVILFICWWFLPKATVTIFVAPKKIEDSISIDLSKNIQSKKIEVLVSGEKTKSTTGTKTVGEKAKGQVRIQNGTAFPINLATGTILVSSTDLKFLTLKQASISGALSPNNPGITVLDVEAGGIGSEYNLTKDEIFKVGSYPKAEVDATVVANFTGGSSRQISSVSEDDRKKLFKELSDELAAQANSKLLDLVPEGQIIIDSTISSKNEEEDFSNKAGDEASVLKLSLSLRFTADVVSKEDLDNISKNILSERVPSGFILRNDQISYVFNDSSSSTDLDAKVTANLLPSIDTLEIAKKIAGRYPSVAEEYLRSVPGFINAEFRLPSILRGKLATLPHVSKNIEVFLSSEQ